MKVEAIVFALLGLFGTIVGPIYGLVTHFKEPVGVTGLLLLAGLGYMVSFYLWLTGRRIGYRPDDNPAGEIDEHEGDYGLFTPHSWWPLWLGLTGSLMFLGMAVGFWVSIIGAFFGIFALVGWTFETYKGRNAW